MKISSRFKVTIKQILANLAVRAFPGRAAAIEQNISDADAILLDRLIRFGLIKKTDRHDRISDLHYRTWAGARGENFAKKYRDRFESWFMSSHISIVDELENLLTQCPGQYKNLYEIGCGDGQVVNYLSTRLKSIDQFVGIDINERVIASNNKKYKNHKLSFVCENANKWIAQNGLRGSILFSNGGVLEYFSEKEIIDLLSKIVGDLRPSLFAIVEPIADDFDLESEKASRPFGIEWSFTHNYPHLFTESGLRIRYQTETITDGIRWILMIVHTNS